MSRSSARPIEKSAEAYRTIGEAADTLGLRPHVLRYWESRFPGLVNPLKRRDGRRMFRPADLDALRAIQLLVHQRGMTLKSARQLLEAHGVATVLGGEATRARPSLATQEAPADSPARQLQASVRAAFDTAQADPTPDSAGPPASAGPSAGLEATLTGLAELKARLDRVRARPAA